MAEGGALLRRYGGINLHRGFESLLLRFSVRRKKIIAGAVDGTTNATGKLNVLFRSQPNALPLCSETEHFTEKRSCA